VVRVTRKPFIDALLCLTIHSKGYFESQILQARDDSLFPWLYWYPDECLFHPRRSGNKLLKFAKTLLPEIDFLDTTDSMGQISSRQAAMNLRTSLNRIGTTCRCQSCNVRTGIDEQRMCFERFALTIMRFIFFPRSRSTRAFHRRPQHYNSCKTVRNPEITYPVME
jgi:hypothetical protein